ncbi:MAG: hypothetical protein GXP31_02010 [Kiritimatiellaeota bacterium]|nr:hypothetical protein [Kiritimatiellota bacterium]
MTKILLILMVVAGIVMLFGMAKQKAGEDWGRPLAIVCAIIALACAIGQIVLRTTNIGAGSTGVAKTELTYVRISMQKLGQYLAEKYPDSKALVIQDPETKTSADRRKAALEGLKKGFGSKITIAATESPAVPKNAKGMMGEMGMSGAPEGEMLPPMEYWLTPQAFDGLVKKHGDCNLLVSTIGLPSQFGKMALWRSVKSKKLKVALGGGSIFELKKLFLGKYIVAAVAYNPKAVYDDKKPPSNIDEAFKKRYLLITPENVTQLAQQYPGLFMQ